MANRDAFERENVSHQAVGAAVLLVVEGRTERPIEFLKRRIQLREQIVPKREFEPFLESRADQITMVGCGERPESYSSDELHRGFGPNDMVNLATVSLSIQFPRDPPLAFNGWLSDGDPFKLDVPIQRRLPIPIVGNRLMVVDAECLAVPR